MDFIEALPLSYHKDMILVVVDRFTKYAHFIAMKHPINAHTVQKTPTLHHRTASRLQQQEAASLFRSLGRNQEYVTIFC
jgi:23S rRNA pseudoU1915 N3-methylase RlmH